MPLPDWASTFLVSLSLAYVVLFAIELYPLIPYSLGGGKPATVMFLLGEKASPDLLARDRTSHRSVPNKLPTTTDKTFVSAAPGTDEKSIEFSRDAVAGVVALRDGRA